MEEFGDPTLGRLVTGIVVKTGFVGGSFLAIGAGRRPHRMAEMTGRAIALVVVELRVCLVPSETQPSPWRK